MSVCWGGGHRLVSGSHARWLVVLLLFTGVVFGGRAGVVVQYAPGNVDARCASFSGSATAADVLRSAGFSIVTKDYGEFGLGLCKIGGTGCEEENCFCGGSSYWGFYLLSGGNWQYSPVGISQHQVGNGEVIGFAWGEYGTIPEARSFGKMCGADAGGEETPVGIRYFEVNVSKSCPGEPANITVLEDGTPVWEPTIFLFPLKVLYGAHVKIYRRNVWLRTVAEGESDGQGRFSFVPSEEGEYVLDVDKFGFLPITKEFVVNCSSPVAKAQNSTSAHRVFAPLSRAPDRVEVSGALVSAIRAVFHYVIS